MNDGHKKRCGMVRFMISAVAIVFGVLTIKSGGDVLFWSEDARVAAGNYVPFVLWFNFIAGFLYIITGVAFAMKKVWAVGLAAVIAVSTIVTFMVLGINIYVADLAYEPRTIGAMVVRASVWSVLFFLSYKSIKQRSES